MKASCIVKEYISDMYSLKEELETVLQTEYLSPGT